MRSNFEHLIPIFCCRTLTTAPKKLPQGPNPNCCPPEFYGLMSQSQQKQDQKAQNPMAACHTHPMDSPSHTHDLAPCHTLALASPSPPCTRPPLITARASVPLPPPPPTNRRGPGSAAAAVRAAAAESAAAEASAAGGGLPADALR
jgi:hypothetical protein